MGPTVTAKTQFTEVPASLAAVALIDAPTAAAAGQMSVSWWHDKVRTGEAPAPVIREPRCTRWRLSDVCAYWKARAESPNLEVANLVTGKAKRASDAARAKRAAAAQ
jgi:predicted DNA-binding transcriptional regulator AlpA